MCYLLKGKKSSHRTQIRRTYLTRDCESSTILRKQQDKLKLIFNDVFQAFSMRRSQVHSLLFKVSLVFIFNQTEIKKSCFI
jgi:hypothetical protein